MLSVCLGADENFFLDEVCVSLLLLCATDNFCAQKELYSHVVCHKKVMIADFALKMPQTCEVP